MKSLNSFLIEPVRHNFNFGHKYVEDVVTSGLLQNKLGNYVVCLGYAPLSKSVNSFMSEK